MDGGRILAFTLALALAASPATSAQLPSLCGGGRYTANSTYETDLLQVVRTLPTNASSSPVLFATAAVGTVYGLALCRGDLSPASCDFCVKATLQDAQVLCPSDMDVAMYYENCNVRLSNQDFLAFTNNTKKLQIFSSAPALSPSVAERFNPLVAEVLNATANYAVASSTKSFATGVIDVNADDFDRQFSKIYASAQCTPDLKPAQCRACLASAMADVLQVVFPSNPQGARVVGDRCSLRFDVYSFYIIDAMVRLQGGQGGKKKPTPVLAIVLPTIIFGGLLAITLIGFFIWRKMRSPRKAPLLDAANREDLENFESIFIDLSTLRSATANFDESNKLGEGGFGAVYKGVLPDEQQVAVKRLSHCSRQGLGQLKDELALVAKLQHKNLVRLIGVCLEEGERVLVYEYLPNKSLDTFIFDPVKSKQLDWGKRYRILNGIARGLQYLHEGSQLNVVHRDLKASNVLLDADMRPKISDFGLAKIFGDDETRNATNCIVGTLGYMSPEYAMRGQYSTKLDVFSFGVLVLEIVTGRRNSFAVNSDHSEDLFGLVWRHWNQGTIAEIVDPSLGRHYPRGEVLKWVNMGLLCVQQNPKDRPSMSSIIVMLGSETVSLQAPYRPAYLIGRSMSYSETAYVQPSSEPQSSITKLEPR